MKWSEILSAGRPSVAEFRVLLPRWGSTGKSGPRPGGLGYYQLGMRPEPREVGEFSLVSLEFC
jgi:hypothetical protein